MKNLLFEIPVKIHYNPSGARFLRGERKRRGAKEMRSADCGIDESERESGYQGIRKWISG